MDVKQEDVAYARSLDAVVWGFMEIQPDGKTTTFVEVPKLPLITAGYRNPPFDVALPNGTVRHIVQRVPLNVR